MADLTCQDFVELVTEYLDGALDEDTARRLGARDRRSWQGPRVPPLCGGYPSTPGRAPPPPSGPAPAREPPRAHAAPLAPPPPLLPPPLSPPPPTTSNGRSHLQNSLPPS